MGQEPPAQIDHDTTAAAPAPSANTEAKPQLNVLVSEIRDELRDIDLAPLALVGEDAIVFLAESDWTERPVMAVA